jgi:hypothetical protein
MFMSDPLAPVPDEPGRAAWSYFFELLQDKLRAMLDL